MDCPGAPGWLSWFKLCIGLHGAYFKGRREGRKGWRQGGREGVKERKKERNCFFNLLPKEFPIYWVQGKEISELIGLQSISHLDNSWLHFVLITTTTLYSHLLLLPVSKDVVLWVMAAACFFFLCLTIIGH